MCFLHLFLILNYARTRKLGRGETQTACAGGENRLCCEPKETARDYLHFGVGRLWRRADSARPSSVRAGRGLCFSRPPANAAAMNLMFRKNFRAETKERSFGGGGGKSGGARLRARNASRSDSATAYTPMDDQPYRSGNPFSFAPRTPPKEPNLAIVIYALKTPFLARKLVKLYFKL